MHLIPSVKQVISISESPITLTKPENHMVKRKCSIRSLSNSCVLVRAIYWKHLYLARIEPCETFSIMTTCLLFIFPSNSITFRTCKFVLNLFKMCVMINNVKNSISSHLLGSSRMVGHLCTWSW